MYLMIIFPDSKSNKIIILLFFLVEVGNKGLIFGEAEKMSSVK